MTLQDKKIQILQEKVDILQKARENSNKLGEGTSTGGGGSGTSVQELEKKCLLLQQQIHEMEVHVLLLIFFYVFFSKLNWKNLTFRMGDASVVISFVCLYLKGNPYYKWL